MLIQRLINEKSRNGYIELDKECCSNNLVIGDKKYRFLPKTNRYYVDSELLLSYIYRKLGLQNPQSYPVSFEEKLGILTEDIANNPSYIHNQRNNYRGGYIFFETLSEASKLHPFYEKELMDSYIKIAIADVIFGIQDRYNGKLFIKKGEFGYMHQVVPIGFAYPSFVIGNEINYYFQQFFNGVYEREETKNVFFNRLKQFDFSKFIQPKEVVELIKSLNIEKCAKEVYNLTGYKINPKFIDYVNKTLDESINSFDNKIYGKWVKSFAFFFNC